MSKQMLSQNQSLKQTTTLTPQQIQEIRILEYPTVELEERIEREIEENPSLEKDDMIHDEETQEADNEELDAEDLNEVEVEEYEETVPRDEDMDEYMSDDEPQDYVSDYTPRASNRSDDDRTEMPMSAGQSFLESIQDQLRLLDIPARLLPIAQYVVGNIGPDGYLRRSTESLVDDLAFKAGITIADEEMEALIQTIQYAVEPAGIGARDLRECLLLQLKRKHPMSPETETAIVILERYFDAYTGHHYARIVERMGLSTDQFEAANREIRGLQPAPGHIYSNDIEPINTIIPDFVVEVNYGRPIVMLNNGHIPELRVNASFADALQQYQKKEQPTKREREEIAFVKDRVEAARWFIDAIRKRNETMLQTMRTIVSIQRAWFMEGDDQLLKPMILKDVAERTGLDISTISRVSNSKYVQTPYGMKQLKFFFSESIRNDQGEDVSTRAIKDALQDIIGKEDKRNPLRDDQLVLELKKHGHRAARRTVAKYRDQLGIPVARLRKTL